MGQSILRNSGEKISPQYFHYNLAMPIHILADDIASQIAAGEVVERPVSVVKELLENAIDAGATHINIRVENAGRTLVEVSDNGIGIPFDQISLAVARHSTSKLQNAADLFHIQTLGFRGEALASIGSVSRMELISKSEDEAAGGRLVVDGGKYGKPAKEGIPVGTVVRVTDLFYNTPARLKFLKKDQTEKQIIETLVIRYALAYSSLAFSLILDGKPVLTTSGNGDRREILAKLYGSDLGRQMLEVVFVDEGIQISGYISPISVTRSNRREITFFVNGRWIQDIALSTALLKAYQSYLMIGRYPVTFLFITLNPEEVDVNVHPAKAEVRFKQPDLLFSVIQRAVRRALLAYSPIPQLSSTAWQGASRQPPGSGPSWNSPALDWNANETPHLNQNVEGSTAPEIQPTEVVPLLRLIGQIGAVYLVAEGPDGLYLIDQHAAHERILYEKMTDRSQPVSSQSLLTPELLHLDPKSAAIVKDNLDTLRRIGFSIEEFGINTLRISAVPAVFIGKDPLAAIRSIVEDFEEDETPLKGYEDARIIARICKRMAVKGGQVLSTEEQAAMIRQLESCKSPRTCPHGRPTMIHLSVDLLERQFGRRGAR
jgi:DNA mismatch repair protein MutL